MNTYSWLAQTAYHIIRIILMIGIGLWAIRYLESRVTKALNKIYPEQLITSIITRFFTYVAWLILLTAVLVECGVNISGLLGAAGVVGVAVGFASQTSVSNIISGLFLMIERPFELEDTLIVNDVEGKVADINLFAITLRTEDNRLARIPNEQLLKNVILNLTRLDMRRYQYTLKVAPHEDFNRVFGILTTVVNNNKYCAPHRPLSMVGKTLTGSYLELVVGAWVPTRNLLHVKETLLIEINTALALENVSLYKEEYCFKELKD